jgi:hypothetical protein
MLYKFKFNQITKYVGFYKELIMGSFSNLNPSGSGFNNYRCKHSEVVL